MIGICYKRQVVVIRGFRVSVMGYEHILAIEVQPGGDIMFTKKL